MSEIDCPLCKETHPSMKTLLKSHDADDLGLNTDEEKPYAG